MDGVLDEGRRWTSRRPRPTPLWYLPNAKEPVCAAAAGGGGENGSLPAKARVDPATRSRRSARFRVARAAPTARAGCATLLGLPDMPAKSAGPVSHDPSGVLNRSSKVGVSIPQLPVPAATSRGSKSGR